MNGNKRKRSQQTNEFPDESHRCIDDEYALPRNYVMGHSDQNPSDFAHNRTIGTTPNKDGHGIGGFIPSTHPALSLQHRRITSQTCDSPQDTAETDSETLSSGGHSDDSLSLHDHDSNCPLANKEFSIYHPQYPMQQQRQLHRCYSSDEEEQLYDSDQSGKYKGHFHHQNFGRESEHGNHSRKYWIRGYIWSFWLFILGLSSMMIANNVRFEIRTYHEIGNDMPSWNGFAVRMSNPMQNKKRSQNQRKYSHSIPSLTEENVFWFLNSGQGEDGLDESRRTDLEVIRRTSSGKSKGFSVRLSASEKGNGMVRKDLLLASIESLALCSKVERIEVDGDADQLWLSHPSGKVQHVLNSHDQEWDRNSDHDMDKDIHNSGSYAVLLLDYNVAISCDDLERGFQLFTKEPDRAVGFFPYRYHNTLDKDSKMRALESIRLASQPYSLMSDRAMFVHRRYLHSKMHAVASKVGKGRPCQTFILSLTASSTSRKPPLGVVGNPVEVRTSDIMLRQNKLETLSNEEGMSQCVLDVMESLGLNGLPVEETIYLGRI